MTPSPSPTIIRQAVSTSSNLRAEGAVMRTAQIIDVDGTFRFQTYDVFSNGLTELDHSEEWTTAAGALSAWTSRGWAE